ncbi:MAG: DNA translocase FtsK 4TM domain-containing protein [Luteibaculum sp.]
MAARKKPQNNRYSKEEKKQAKEKKPLKFSFAFLKDARFKRVCGAFFIVFSLVLFLSFTSYLFTWQDDQSVVAGKSFWALLNPEIQVSNWLGKVGAWLSHHLIHQSFGIASYFFVVISFVLGLKIAFGFSLIAMPKLIKNAIFNFIFLPYLLGYFFSGNLPFLGGSLGYNLTEFFGSLLGNLGSALLLTLMAFGYVVFTFNPAFENLKLFGNSGAEPSTKKKDEDAYNKILNAELHSDLEEVKEEESIVDDEENEEDLKSSHQEDLQEPADTEEENDEEFEVVDASDESQEESNVEQEDEAELEIDENSNLQEDELSDKELNKRLKDFGPYDPKLDLSSFKLPPIELLEEHGSGHLSVEERMDKTTLEENKQRIIDTLQNYKIGISKIKATIGPTVTLYEIVPEAGVRISKIKNLEDDIALSLAALGIRIIAPIPGRGTIGIEVPNTHPDMVSMRTLIKGEKFQNTKFELPVALGKTISNETFIADLAKMPHLLMAGATGQGKSVGLNAILVSLMYKKHPAQIKFVLVDPKKVELNLFNKIERHYLAKLPDEEEAIITDTSKVVKTLNSLCVEMDHRYELLKDAQVRNIKEYNQKFINRRLNPELGHKYLPYIVLVVDEFADLIMTAGKEVELPIARLAQLARAIGIHLIIATQRPSVNIITGIIKANFPARIAFRVTSKVDSRTILDSGGAEQLIGRGDMLFSTGNDLVRLQCGFVDTPEVENICDYVGEQRAYPSAFMLPEVADDNESGSGGDISDEDLDELFEDAARIIVNHQQGSTSLLQRKLKLGYNRAGRIVDQLEAAGVVGPFEGSKARKVLIPDEVSLEQFLSQQQQNSNT